MVVFFCKQKTAYEMRISDWSSDVCSSDLPPCVRALGSQRKARIRISIIPIGICPASSQESAVQSVETLEQDGRKIHARPQSRQKSRCCRGLPVPFPRWHNLAIGYS